MKKTKITKHTEEVERFKVKCSHCGKEIIGSTENQCLWNLSIHIMSNHNKKTKGDSGVIEEVPQDSNDPNFNYKDVLDRIKDE